jgi:Uma2 family endonuclease
MIGLKPIASVAYGRAMSVLMTHRFTVEDFHRMGETGVLKPDARVELMDGEIIDMAPIGPFHGGSTKRLIKIFSRLSKDRWLLSAQDPIQLNEHSEPQPDLMLLKPAEDDYSTRHPRPDDVFLLIEVADTSLMLDRDKKLPSYGRAGIPEVWILNLTERRLEVYREPHFAGYSSVTVLRAGDQACPLTFPDAVLEVEDLLRQGD